MNFKIVAGLIGLLLFLAFIAPPVIKLKQVSLGIITLVTLAMVIYEFVESVRNRDD